MATGVANACSELDSEIPTVRFAPGARFPTWVLTPAVDTDTLSTVSGRPVGDGDRDGGAVRRAGGDVELRAVTDRERTEHRGAHAVDRHVEVGPPIRP
jgi:hypothetical protein